MTQLDSVMQLIKTLSDEFKLSPCVVGALCYRVLDTIGDDSPCDSPWAGVMEKAAKLSCIGPHEEWF
ncbi:MAG: hypothetical protein MIO92_13570 [Methanosarcinaceae archaeon]|nr:hypothetical protein [Methanosarcinaceae archaeon]